MQEYLLENHKDAINQILAAETLSDIPFQAVEVNLVELSKKNDELFKRVINRDNIWKEKVKWTEALEQAQKTLHDQIESNRNGNPVKNLFPVTFVNHPSPGIRSRDQEIFQLVEVTGNVTRTRDVVKMEVTREFRCRKCQQSKIFEAERLYDFAFDDPTKCVVSRGCNGSMFNTAKDDEELDLDRYIDFQVIFVKLLSNLNDEDLKVELDEEYTELCVVGDQVTILGVIETRSVKDVNNFKIVLRAASLKVHQTVQTYNSTDKFEILCEIFDEWDRDKNRLNGDEALVRDEMLSSVANEIEGLAMIKFGLLLTLCSGGSAEKEEGSQNNPLQKMKKREICHMLMIGDPGLGKSQILRAAVDISLNPYKTVGYAATAAGLIGGIFRDEGSDHIEGGALVKANNGICCIDEFNLLPKEHRSSIHEAMEHQTVTFEKASLKVKLPAKCSIIGAMNQKNASMGIESSNLTIEQSLLSRFDLVFDLEDPHDIEATMRIVNRIFNNLIHVQPKWSCERLQKHVMVAKDMAVTISNEANQVIQNYFVLCKHNNDIEPSRRTMRLLTSLQRLTKCHAKLMLRQEAVIEDALNVIMVNEQTWSFGHLLKKENNVKVNLPLNMSQRTMTKIMNDLDLGEIWEEYLEKKFSNTASSRTTQKTQKRTTQTSQSIDVDNIFSDNFFDNIVYGETSNELEPSSSTRNHRSFEHNETLSLSTFDELNTFVQKEPSPEKTLQSGLDELCFALIGENSKPKSEPTSKKSSMFSKLKKFQYETQSQESQSEPSAKTVVESIAKEDDIDDEFDLWGSLSQEPLTNARSNKENIEEKKSIDHSTFNEDIFDNFDVWSEI